VTDGHKWLNVPYDCGMVICLHLDALRGAMGIAAAYMPASEDVPAKDLVLEFSRRPRGIPVWAALRTLGRAGVAEMVDRCCSHARWLAEGLRGLGWEVHNDVVLNQVVASVPRSADHAGDPRRGRAQRRSLVRRHPLAGARRGAAQRLLLGDHGCGYRADAERDRGGDGGGRGGAGALNSAQIRL
jgi:glutamate/tyrosine decarboxylase-like PLP-dependent enzyme